MEQSKKNSSFAFGSLPGSGLSFTINPFLMKNFATYLLAAAVGLTTLGCSKKTEAPSKTELLTNKNWVVTAQTVSPGIVLTPGGTAITDLYQQGDACGKDDFIRFETPNVYKEDEGAVKCKTTDPQTKIGTWVFNSDQTILTVTPQAGTAESVNITELTDASLKVNVSQVSNAVTYTITTTFKKS